MRFTRILAALTFAMLVPAAATAAPLTCLNFAEVATTLVQNNTNTSSTTPVNIAGASVNNIAGANSCVVVELVAQFKAPQGARVSLLVTGVSPAPSVFPPTQDIITSGTGYDERKLTFVLPKVNCSCLVQVRIQSLKSGQTISGGRGVLRVRYNNNS